MKKLLLIVVTLIPLSLFGQAILNGAFEDWTSTSYDQLDGWFNSNQESVPNTGLKTAFRTTTSQSGYAIRLVTVTNGTDTAGGYFTNSQGDIIAGEGGVPYAGMPTALTGYCKYDLPGNDTAIILVLFKSGGSVVSFDVFKIRGTGQQANYQAFNFPLSLSVTADTVIIAAACSNLLTGEGVSVGSTLYLDQLAFTGSGSVPPIPNGDFEDWSFATINQLNGWGYWGGDNNVLRSTDSFRDLYALQLTSFVGNGDPRVGNVTNGERNSGSGSQHGRPYTQTTDTLSGYYKYENSTGDSGVLYMGFYANGINVGGGWQPFTPTSTYTRFEIPINLSAQPDSVQIDINSSIWPYDPAKIGSGSSLWIDQLQFASEPITIGISELPRIPVRIFPNPAVDRIQLDFSEVLSEGTIEILAAFGAKVRLVRFNDAAGCTVDVSDLAAGNYVLRLKSGQRQGAVRFQKQ